MKKTLGSLSVNEEGIVRGVVDIQEKATKNGKPYVLLKITDEEGTTATEMVWSDNPKAELLLSEIKPGDRIEAQVVCTQVKPYRNISVKNITTITEEATVAAGDVKEQLRNILSEIKHPGLKALVTAVFKRMGEKIFEAPASEVSAYAYRGGLANYMVVTANIAKAVAQSYNNMPNITTKISEDALVVASLLANIGKCITLTFEEDRIVKTKKGELFPDSYYTAKIVAEEMGKIQDFLTEDQKLLMEHILASSKGDVKWDALCTPRSREAEIFASIMQIAFIAGKYENLDKTISEGNCFSRSYNGGKIYYLGTF